MKPTQNASLAAQMTPPPEIPQLKKREGERKGAAALPVRASGAAGKSLAAASTIAARSGAGLPFATGIFAGKFVKALVFSVLLTAGALTTVKVLKSRPNKAAPPEGPFAFPARGSGRAPAPKLRDPGLNIAQAVNRMVMKREEPEESADPVDEGEEILEQAEPLEEDEETTSSRDRVDNLLAMRLKDSVAPQRRKLKLIDPFHQVQSQGPAFGNNANSLDGTTNGLKQARQKLVATAGPAAAGRLSAMRRDMKAVLGNRINRKQLRRSSARDQLKLASYLSKAAAASSANETAAEYATAAWEQTNVEGSGEDGLSLSDDDLDEATLGASSGDDGGTGDSDDYSDDIEGTDTTPYDEELDYAQDLIESADSMVDQGNSLTTLGMAIMAIGLALMTQGGWMIAIGALILAIGVYIMTLGSDMKSQGEEQAAEAEEISEDISEEYGQEDQGEIVDLAAEDAAEGELQDYDVYDETFDYSKLQS